MRNLVFLVLFLSIGCSKEKSHSTDIATSSNSIDTLSNKIVKLDEYPNQEKISDQNTSVRDSISIIGNKNEKIDIIEVTTNLDTLNIVSTSNYLFYPFGKFYKINEFKKLNTCFSNDEKQKYSNNNLETYNVTCKESHVVFIPDKRVGSTRNIIEIVSGDILDKEVVLASGIRVGLKKQEVFNILIGDSITNHYSKSNTLKLISGLDGIYHLYIFRNEYLENIKFISTYNVAQ